MMRRWIVWMGMVALLAPSVVAAQDAPERREMGQLVLEDIPEIPPELEARLFQYQNTRSASLSGWLPEGQGMIIRTRFAEVAQVHRVAQPMGAREQLTFFPEPVRGASVQPGVAAFLFRKDVGGSEMYQIFHFDMRTGTSRMLTDGTSRNGAQLWSNRGDRFAFYSTARNGTDWDIYVADVDPDTPPELLLEREGTWFPVDWSADDARMLIGQYVSRNESRLFILTLADGSLTEVNPTETPVAYGDAWFSADGQHLYMTLDQGSEFQRLVRYDIESGAMEPLTEGIPWDVETVHVKRHADGDHVAFVVNADGVSELYLLDPESGVVAPVAGVPAGQIYGLDFDPVGGRLGFVVNTAQSPGDVYSLDLDGGAITRWTRSEVGGLDTSRFVSPELIRYPTFDKDKDGAARQIPAFVFSPEGEAEAPRPVVIRIHGGPESQYRPYFSSLTQFLVGELGLVVIAPNVRGSSGYGKNFLKLDNAYLREDSVKDIGALLDWIGEQPELDASRVAVMGGSYGGYMVLASMIHFSERLVGGIDNVGISNFVTFLENTKPYRRDLRRVEYGDERDPEMRAFLESISPTTHAHTIDRPMLVVQGANDPRVPLSEAEQIVAAMREKGGEVWYLMARDEGHGFRKKFNRDVYYSAIALFLERVLLGEGRE